MTNTDSDRQKLINLRKLLIKHFDLEELRILCFDLGLDYEDLAGNVWEWTASWYDEDEQWRALRGGSWYDNRNFARAAYRASPQPADRSFNFGFRVVRRPP